MRALLMRGYALVLACTIAAMCACGTASAAGTPGATPKPPRPPGAAHVPAPVKVPFGTVPAVELVETVPVESDLGNPALPSAHDVWLEMIRSATSKLDFEEFYVSDWPNEPTNDLLREIGAAAKRGVTVRWVVDRGMHETYPLPIDSLGRLPNVSVRVIDMRKIAGGIQHAKFFIVDGREVFVGSQNFDWRALKHIHELGVRVRDERVARAFGGVFAMDWVASDTTRAPAERDAAIASVANTARTACGPLPVEIMQNSNDVVKLAPSWSPHGFIPDSAQWDRDVLVRLIDAARHEIVVQTLTYSIASHGARDSSLDVALRRAAARGVTVKMVVSDWEKGTSGMAALQSLSKAPNVSVKLGTVPQWSGGYIPFGRVEHLKYMVVDTLATWVGTANWEPSYFWGTRNLAVTMWNRPIAREARTVFEASWRSKGAAPLSPDSTYAPKIRGATPPPGMKVYGN